MSGFHKLETTGNIASKIAIIGTAGVPAAYGGFETLAEYLVRHHSKHAYKSELIVFCSGTRRTGLADHFLSARLIHIPIGANGIQSVIYDIVSLAIAIRNGSNTLLILGVSGGVFLPIIRLLSKTKLVTNIDGIEWKREKWGALARWFLRTSEKFAVKWSHEVIADNKAIAQ